MLYLNAPFFNLCLGEMKSDVLVKTDERGLRIIQDAEGLFQAKDDPACNIVTVCGVDTMRMQSYQIIGVLRFTQLIRSITARSISTA